MTSVDIYGQNKGVKSPWGILPDATTCKALTRVSESVGRGVLLGCASKVFYLSNYIR